MAIALVAGSTKTANTTVSSLTLPVTAQSATAGNTLILGIVTDVGTSNDITVADSVGNTNWTKVYSVVLTDTFTTLEFWYCYNCKSGANIVTVTTGDAANMALVLREYSGLLTTANLDKDAEANSANAGTLSLSSGATATTTVASELVIGFGVAGGGDHAWTAGSGYGNMQSSNATGAVDCGMEDKIVSSTGAQTATATLDGNAWWGMAVATFKGTGSPTPSVSDSTAVTATPTILIPILKLNVSDSTATTDTPAMGGTLSLAVTDSTAVSDTKIVSIVSFIAVSESTAVSDTPTVREILFVSVSESTAVTDTPIVAETASRSTITWKGYTWDLRDGGTGSPGYGGWSQNNISLPDQNNYVHFWIQNPTGSQPLGAELDNETVLGYGTYLSVVETGDMTAAQKNIVWGALFPINGATPYGEFDMGETSKWDIDFSGVSQIDHEMWYGNVSSPTNAGSADIQPTSTDTVVTNRLIWAPGSATFDTFQGVGTGGTNLFHSHYTSNVPAPNGQIAAFNLWLYNSSGQTPVTTTATNYHLVVRDFEFSPGVVVSDSTAISDTPTISIQGTATPKPSVTDTTAVSDTPTMGGTLYITGGGSPSTFNNVGVTFNSSSVNFNGLSSATDSTAVTDSANVEIIKFISELESTAVSDSVITRIISTVSVSESTAVSDTPQVEIIEQGVSVIDSTVVSDVASAEITSYIVNEDDTAVTDSVAILVTAQKVVANDSTAIIETVFISIITFNFSFFTAETLVMSDTPALSPTPPVVVSDSVGSSETVFIHIVTVTPSIFTADTLVVSDVPKLALTPPAVASDSTAVIETVFIQIQVPQSIDPFTADIVVTSDAPVLSMTSNISLEDDTAVTDSSVVDINVSISIEDDTAVTESVSFTGLLLIDAQESIVVSDTQFLVTEITLSVSSTINVSDAVQMRKSVTIRYRVLQLGYQIASYILSTPET